MSKKSACLIAIAYIVLGAAAAEEFCAEEISGPGASPLEPIPIENFFDLFDSALTWGNPTLLEAERKFAEEDGVEIPIDYNCRWVRVRGYFRVMFYRGYSGTINANSQEFYLRGGINGPIRENSYTIENFEDPKTNRFLFNGAEIEIIGQFYDMCRALDAEYGDGNHSGIGGLCHYGDAQGLVFRNVGMTGLLSEPFSRPTGEENRAVIGDLVNVPDNWPKLSEVIEIAKARIELIRESPASYWEKEIPATFDRSSDIITKRSNDPNEWISFLHFAPQSPINQKSFDPAIAKTKVFQQYYSIGQDPDDISSVFVCFCTTNDCKNQWPLFKADAEYFYDPYLCIPVSKNYRSGKWE